MRHSRNLHVFQFTVLFFTLLLTNCTHDPVTLLTEARQRLKEGKPNEAISLLEEVLKSQPQNHEALNMKGVAHFQHGENAKALENFNQAIEKHSEDYRYFYNRGNAKRAVNDQEGAYIDYTQALSLDSGHYEVYLNRALVLVGQKRLMAALSDFNKATQLNGEKDTNVLFYRGKARLLTLDFQGAAQDFRKCIGTNENDSEAHYQLAMALFGQEKNEEGCQSATKAKELGHEKVQGLLESYCR